MSSFYRQGGFTLMELVIAMGLFAVGMLGLCLITSGLMENNSSARNRADATLLGQNKLETLGRGEYSEITDSLEEHLDAPGGSGGGVFRREVVVAEKTSPACKEVAVTVSWQSNGAHRVVLKTVYAP
jgi:prepilin-type N-terminal cleavage/methylation domain-containing protein